MDKMSHERPIEDSRSPVTETFTPGPWTARGGGSGPRKPDPDMLDWSSGVDCSAPFTENEHGDFARVEEQTVAIAKGRTLAEAEANARLIAAAPDMRKVLISAAHALRSYQYGNAATDLAAEIADGAEALIRKIDDRTEAKPSTGL